METGYAPYFVEQVLRKRPYLRRSWCERVLVAPVREQRQPDGRWRFWAAIPELGGRYLRVVTLADRVTILNAFPDRGFQP
jgi:hypothetical protein